MGEGTTVTSDSKTEPVIRLRDDLKCWIMELGEDPNPSELLFILYCSTHG